MKVIDSATAEAGATPRRLKHYRALPEEERRILQVLSGVYTPIDQTRLRRVLDRLGWKSRWKDPLSRLVVKSLRERLLDKGLLLYEKNLLRCHPDILEILAREAALEGRFDEIARAAEAVMPLAPVQSGFYGYRRDPEQEFRALRDAFHRGDDGEVLRRLGTEEKSYQPLPYAQAEPLIRICTRPWDGAWFDSLSMPLRLQVLAPLLTESAHRLEDRRQAYALFERDFAPLAAQHRALAYVLAEQRMHRAALSDVEVLLANDDSPAAQSRMGWLRFLQGANAEAIACFEAALKGARRRSRKRNLHIQGLAGVFYVLALLRDTGPKRLEAARTQIRLCLASTEPEPFEPVFRLLGDSLAVLRGQLRAQQSVWLQRESLTLDPYLDLFRCLALRWLGEKNCARQAAKLTRFCRQASAAGLHWYACESARLLETLGQAADWLPVAREAAEAARLQTIVDLVKPHEPWELALQALKEVSNTTDRPRGDGEESSLRMAWRLECFQHTCLLEPREQKRTKSGGWSRGRKVSLERLHESPDDFDYVTAQDREICQQIRMETEYTHYGRYPRTSYYLDEDKALLAAVGHPALFWADTPDLSVELVRDEPVLQVRNDERGLLIDLEPRPEPFHRVLALEEGPQRVRVVEFTPEHERIAQILGEAGLRVPGSAREKVLESIAAIAPLLTIHSEIGGGAEAAAEPVEADVRPHIQLQPAGEGLKLDCYVRPFTDGGPLFYPGQGGTTVFAEVRGERLQTTRDRAAELQGAERVLEHCVALDQETAWSWTLDDAEIALETLLQLQELGESVVLEWPQGKKMRLQPQLGLAQMLVSVRKERDWFALDGQLRLEEGHVLGMRQLLELVQQSPGRFVRLSEGEFLSLTHDLRRRLDELQAFSRDGRFHPLAANAIEEATEGMAVDAGKAWKEQLARLEAAQELEPQIPSTLQADLRPYQVEGFRWLARLAHWGAGACLADDMGLGKTLQALALILSHAPCGPTLVLAPTSVCANWLEETQRFAPTLKPRRFGGGDRRRMLDEAGPFDLIVCSYGLLQTEGEQLAGVNWQCIVADEAQAIKNTLTKRSRAAMALSGEFKLITTGTPIENHLGELWNLFQFINPGLLGSLQDFNRSFAYPIENRKDRGAQLRLKKLIRPFILRRLKSDVLAELPPRTEITLQVELSEQELAFYEALRRQAMERIGEPEDHPGQRRVKVLTEIMRLRRACCNPRLVTPGIGIDSAKLQAFREILEELRENRHKALVFSQFVGHLTLIREHLDAQGIAYQYLDGATPVGKRKAAVDAFQAGEGDLFLISLKAGGAGLNLTAADYVIHMDPWWNPAVEDQASDRAHRIGQQRPVTIYRLVAKNTIEDKILALHQHKRDLADSLLEGSDLSGKMSVDEMINLIREGREF